MEENWKEDIIKSRLGGKKDWTEGERKQLCEELDREIDEKLNECGSSKRPEDAWTEDNWKEKMGEHPIFSPYLQEDGATEGEAALNPLSEGLAQLKFHPDHNTPIDIARNYKEEGITHFKYKKYRFASASFGEALKQRFADDELRSQLHNNRAAAQMRIGNYRSAIKDCESAVNLSPSYRKALVRATECATKLKSWDEVIGWCDRILKDSPTDKEFLDLRKKAIQEKKIVARNERKKAQELKEKDNELEKVFGAIKIRGITLGDKDLQPNHPTAQGEIVHLNETAALIWPVRFMYPEHGESDFIKEFHENNCFADHLDIMFGDGNLPPWDEDRKYTCSNLKLYYEDSEKMLIEVDSKCTLLQAISNERYRVFNGTPVFIILVKGTAFIDSFLNKYK